MCACLFVLRARAHYHRPKKKTTAPPHTHTHAHARVVMLSSQNQFDGDGELFLEKKKHRCVSSFTKQTAEISVTALVSRCFEQFDARIVIEKNYNKWKLDASSNYFDLIQECNDDYTAKDKIKSMWNDNGRISRELGTALHDKIDRILNGEKMAHDFQLPEIKRCEYFLKLYNLTPIRTELITFFKDDNKIRLAGSVDLLAKDTTTGNYVLVDWKLSSKDLGPHANTYGKKGIDVCSDLDDNYFT